MQMLTVRLDPDRATLKEVQRRLGLSPDEIDDDFGVVNIDPEQNLYAIMVEEQTGARLSDDPDVKGPYANPRIEPFGPPQGS